MQQADADERRKDRCRSKDLNFPWTNAPGRNRLDGCHGPAAVLLLQPWFFHGSGRVHPLRQLIGEGEDARPRTLTEAMDGKALLLLQLLDGTLVTVEVGGDLFPGVQPP